MDLLSLKCLSRGSFPSENSQSDPKLFDRTPVDWSEPTRDAYSSLEMLND